MSDQHADFYLQGTDVEKEAFRTDCSVNFEWNIVYACNFRCSYCIFAGKWEEYGPRNVFLGVDGWMKIWERINRLSGRCSILLTGGEPFIYPEFIELIRRLSQVHYPINISSNGSGDLEKFVAAVDPRRVSVTLSFHPEFNDLDDIIRKKKFLKSRGFEGDYINLCCYPPFVVKLDAWVKQARDQGEMLKVIPYMGPFEGKQYPDAYTTEEKKKLGIDAVWEGNVKRRGRFCKAGMKSALIFPDGKVARCGQVGERLLVGNIFDENFKLFDRMIPCDVEYCPCLEAEAGA